jgi:environmental stress-induced protein Ves
MPARARNSFSRTSTSKPDRRAVARLLRDAERRDVPWRNGRGTTRDVLVGDGVRVSLARIERDAPFSAFPGFARTILLAEGDGFALRFADRERRLDHLFESFVFAGEETPEVRLLGAPCRALNVMTDRQRARHSLEIVRTRLRAPGALLVVLDGEARIGGERLLRCDAAELADEAVEGSFVVALVRVIPLC